MRPARARRLFKVFLSFNLIIHLIRLALVSGSSGPRSTLLQRSPLVWLIYILRATNQPRALSVAQRDATRAASRAASRAARVCAGQQNISESDTFVQVVHGRIFPCAAAIYSQNAMVPLDPVLPTTHDPGLRGRGSGCLPLNQASPSRTSSPTPPLTASKSLKSFLGPSLPS